MKRCSVCKKERDDFSPDKRAKDGLQPACRECSRRRQAEKRAADVDGARAKMRDYYARNREAVLRRNNAWRTENRDAVCAEKREYYQRVKDTTEYKAAVAARQAATVDQKREYDKAYIARNRPRIMAWRRVWLSQNKPLRRAILQKYNAKRRVQESAGASSRDVASWISGQLKACVYCGTDCADNFHVDHFMPLARGGRHEISNLRIACPTCNMRKSAKLPFHWLCEYLEAAANDGDFARERIAA